MFLVLLDINKHKCEKNTTYFKSDRSSLTYMETIVDKVKYLIWNVNFIDSSHPNFPGAVTFDQLEVPAQVVVGAEAHFEDLHRPSAPGEVCFRIGLGATWFWTWHLPGQGVTGHYLVHCQSWVSSTMWTSFILKFWRQMTKIYIKKVIDFFSRTVFYWLSYVNIKILQKFPSQVKLPSKCILSKGLWRQFCMCKTTLWLVWAQYCDTTDHIHAVILCHKVCPTHNMWFWHLLITFLPYGDFKWGPVSFMKQHSDSVETCVSSTSTEKMPKYAFGLPLNSNIDYISCKATWKRQPEGNHLYTGWQDQ